MTSNVEVTGIGESILTGSVPVKLPGLLDLRGQVVYNAISTGNNLIGGLTVIQKDNKYISGSIKIRPHNYMTSNVEVVQPPIKPLETSIIKDTGCYDSFPHINFGSQDITILGKANKEDNQLLIYAKTGDLTQDELDHIVSAKLILKLQNKATKNSNIKLYTNFINWTEYGVKYVNMPTDGLFIKEYTVNAGDESIEIDLLDYVSNNITTGVNDFNFKLIADKNCENLKIYSRESNKSPELYIGAKYYPDSIGIKKISGSFIVKQTDIKDISGSIFLNTGIFNNVIPGILPINKKDESKELSGEIITKRIDINDLSGNVSIHKFDDNKNLIGFIPVREKREHNLVGKIQIKLETDNKNLSGEIIIKKYAENNFGGRIQLNNVNIEENLSGSIVVKKKSSKELSGTISINAYNYNNIDGSIDIISPYATYLSGSIRINAINGKDLNGNININSFNNCKDLSCNLEVMDTQAEYLNGSIMVSAYNNKDLNCILDIKDTKIKDLLCSIDINPINTYDLSCNVTVKQESFKELSGNIIVKYDGDITIPCSILVSQFTGDILEGSIIVKQEAIKELSGSINVNSIWANDIPCTIKISNKGITSYAYII